MNLELTGKYAFVTGGTHGIGQAIALALAQEGCRVAVCSRSQERVRQTLAMLMPYSSESIGIECDVLDQKDLDKTAEQISREWKQVDILIHNVGGGGRWGKHSMLETEDSVWRDVYQKNAGAAIYFTKHFLPFMLKKNWGRVIAISSIYGKESGGRPWFTMAKAAEISLMKTLASNPEYAGRGITFNTVAPGNIQIPDTGWDEIKKNDPAAYQKALEEEPSGRLGTPEEVAYAVACLCSPKASYINGTCISVDGGRSKSF
ncbi:MAG: SDR family oxidoreductase [Candidatus Omnitrophica bacterium]|nr:SDR family oxidoreductase [Candidatus Omnitrophota bacterium]